MTADGTLHEIDGGDADRCGRRGSGSAPSASIYSATLRTVTNFRIDRTDRAAAAAPRCSTGSTSFADTLDHFEFYVFPHTETALCRESTRTQAPAEPPSPAAVYAQEVVVENWLAGAFAQVARHVPAAIPTLSRLAAAGTGKSRKLDASFRVYASERRVRFTEMEYAIPRANAREAVERVLEIASRPELEVCFPIEVRFVAGDDAMLSPAHGRDSAYVAVHHDHRGDWQPYFDAVATVMADYGGRPHWGKRHSLDRARARRALPAVRGLQGGPRPARSGRRLRQPLHRAGARPGRRAVSAAAAGGADPEAQRKREALAAVGGRPRRRSRRPRSGRAVEALAELARLGVAHVDAVADPEPDGDLAEQRRLHLAGALVAVEVEARAAATAPAGGRRPPAPEAT